MSISELTTSTSAMRAVFKSLDGIVGKYSSYPILKAVHISGKRFTVTDLDIEVCVNGGVAHPPKKPLVVEYGAIKRMLPFVDSEELSIQLDDENVALQFNGAEYALPSYDAGDFPKMEFEDAPKSNIGNLCIVDAMKAVRFAISDEPTRYYLNGVCFSEDANGQACIVATNGHLLACKPISFLPDGAANSILHGKAVDYLIRQGSNPDAVQFAGKKCRFTLPGATVTAKLIDGTYPNWTRVVPQDAQPFVSFKRAQLAKALRRILAFRSNHVQVGTAIELQDKSASLKSGESAEHQFAEKISAEILSGDQTRFGVNAVYLLKVCKAFGDCETITLHRKPHKDDDTSFYHWGEPINVSGDGSDLHVTIMPMRV
jgi:DNA polymerase-3 subunit beta